MVLMTQRHWIVVVVLAICLAHPLPATAQDEDAPLQGEFAVTIAPEDVPRDLIDGASLIGRWQITFNADGSFARARQDVGTLASGQFQTDGGRVTLQPESGLLACPPTGETEASATYEWEITGERLRLIAIEEPCVGRRLLLTTRALSPFTACPQPAAGGSAVGTPAALVLEPPLGQSAAAMLQPQGPPDAAIESLLGQMSACWATRQPGHFLPLLSKDFQAEVLPNADESQRFALTMGAPIVWDQASEVELTDRTHVAATVRQTAGDEVDFVRYVFVFEDGAWRWDGAAQSVTSPVPGATPPVDLSPD